LFDNRIKGREALSNYEDFNYANLATISITGNGGGSLFRVNSSPSSTSFALTGGSGADSLRMTHRPNAINTPTCHRPGRNDAFTLDSSASNLASTFTILPGQMSRVRNGASGAYSFSNIESTTLNATVGDDTINFNGYFATALAVNANGGNDTINFIGDNAP